SRDWSSDVCSSDLRNCDNQLRLVGHDKHTVKEQRPGCRHFCIPVYQPGRVLFQDSTPFCPTLMQLLTTLYRSKIERQTQCSHKHPCGYWDTQRHGTSIDTQHKTYGNGENVNHGLVFQEEGIRQRQQHIYRDDVNYRWQQEPSPDKGAEQNSGKCRSRRHRNHSSCQRASERLLRVTLVPINIVNVIDNVSH